MARAFSIVPSRIAPSAAPYAVPEPPKMFTPPTTTAATTASSKPVPARASTVPKRALHSTPARPHRAPHSTNAANTRRPDGTPAPQPVARHEHDHDREQDQRRDPEDAARRQVEVAVRDVRRVDLVALGDDEVDPAEDV